jgi:RNA polymerase sigma factor (sigma-70 family)
MANGQLTKVVRHLRRLLGAPGGSDLTDRQLLDRFTADRDEEAFATLVARHAPLVLGVSRRVLGNEQDAEDVFQAAFLLLGRKAGTVGWHESVGNWLYCVAYHLASKLRLQSARRRKHEHEAATMQARNASDPVDWQQLGRVLDEELHQVPEKYRMPLLLCYLHGKTRDEAAEQLGWTLGEVKGRLERGRELLRSRLTRRGLTLSAALLPALLTEGQLTAAPASLVATTVQAAVTGAIAAPVAALLREGVQAMFWAKVKIAAVVLLTVGGIGSAAGYWTWQASSHVLSLPTPANPQGGRTQELVEIPLKNIWATNMPGTKAMDSYRSGKPDFLYRAPEGPLVAEIGNVLRNTANAPLEGFAVVGHDMAALKDAHRLFTEDSSERFNDRAPKTTLFGRAVTFPQRQPLSLVFSLYVAAGHAHIQKVTRKESTVIIDCNFVPGDRLTLLDKTQLALIPLGTLPPGKYRVEINGKVDPKATGLDDESRKKWQEHLASRVCRSFEFTVAAGGSEEIKSSQPAEKDGLSVIVTPRKAVLKPGEPLECSLVLKNASQQPRSLHLAAFNSWQCAIRPEGNEAAYQASVTNPAMAEDEISSDMLAPGESRKLLLRVGKPFVELDKEFKPVRKSDELAAGKYSIVFLILPNDVAIDDGSEGKNKRPANWTEAVAANPVEFEIAALTPLPIDSPAAKAAMEPVLIGDESNGKTVSVPVGRLIEVRLAGKRANTGWEGGQVKGDAVKHLNSGAQPDRRPTRPGLQALPFGSEFLPEAGAADKAIGTYVFCYEAVKEGKAELNMAYIAPGGPGITKRARSALIAEFKVTIEVTASTTKVSEPAVKDGLAVTLKLSKTVFAADEPPAFETVLENRSAKAFKLLIASHEVDYPYSCTNVGDKISWRVQQRQTSAVPPPQIVTLEPGKSHNVPVVLHGPFVGNRGEGRPARLPPGKYSLAGTIVFKEWIEKSAVPYWTGAITSNSVEFEVADKPAGDAKASESAEKNSLSVTVTPARAKFGYTEPLLFTVVFANTSKEAFKLLAPDHPQGWKLSFDKVDGDFGFSVEQGNLPAAKDSSQPLEPGKSLALLVQLSKVNFKLNRKAPPNKPDGIPGVLGSVLPGRYRVTFTKEFQAGADKNTPWWTGEITAKAVEVEINAGTADGIVHFDKAKQPAGPLEIEIAAPKPPRALNDFQKRLDKSLTPAKAELVFGKPDGITGSGLLIYVYDLDDGTKIWLGFGGFAPIVYAHHVQKDDGKFVNLPLK